MGSLNLSNLVHWTGLKERCSREGCIARNLNPKLMGRKSGVRIGESWFCGPDCFREGVEIRLRELRQGTGHRRAQHPSRIPLGLLLVSRGCISHDQLHTAVERQHQRGGALGNILCDLRFATERQIAEATATQWGCPVYSASMPSHEIQARIPSALLTMEAMAPVYYAMAANKLLIGFVHGIDHYALGAIEQMTSCVTEPCFITISECRDRIRSLAGRNIEVSFHGMSSVVEMANIIQSYAFQIGADEARFATCRGLLWIRLNRDAQPTDLLFSATNEYMGDSGFEEIEI